MAKSGATRIFENLIKVDDIDVNHRTKEGHTPLILASLYGHLDIVSKLLASRKTDVDAIDLQGYTALLRGSEPPEEDQKT